MGKAPNPLPMALNTVMRAKSSTMNTRGICPAAPQLIKSTASAISVSARAEISISPAPPQRITTKPADVKKPRTPPKKKAS
ncbi:hypothetical protein AZA_82745 [Nitrospirillum viridazoti Y2]|nr:hypothetical protein AZA_82745 [Nitrospirillum amazonense Y2]